MLNRNILSLAYCLMVLCLQHPTLASEAPAGGMHLYLLIGQSNMAGRGAVAEADRTAHPRVFVLNRENCWVPAVEPLHFDKPEYVGVGPGLAFGKAVAEADPDITVGLIPCAVGGSPIMTWMAGAFHKQTKSHPYDDALKRARIATERGELKGILWHQGEGDSNAENGPLYKQRLIELIANLRKELNAPDVPFIAATLADEFVARKPESAYIHKAIEEVAGTVENVTWVSAHGLECRDDRVHFNADSARELGRRYAEAALHMK